MARLLATIYRQVGGLLARRGLAVGDAPDVDPLAEEPLLVLTADPRFRDYDVGVVRA